MSFRSSGCNYQQYSQSQKMSIGIVIESVGKPRYGSMKEADISVTRDEKEASNVDHLMGKNNVQRGVKGSSTVSECRNDVVQEGSVRVTAGLFSANLRMEGSDHVENQASRLAISSLQGKEPTRRPKSYVNQAMSEPGVGQKTAINGNSDKENKRVFMDETSENFSGALRQQQVSMPVKEVFQEQPNGMENRSKEALRMKLREILGTVPSGNYNFATAKASQGNANEMATDQNVKGHAPYMLRQNSDTIETNSENVDMTIKRPVTRSLAKRRVPARKHQRNLKSDSLLCDKEECQDSDIFSFAEKSVPSPACVVTSGCSIVEKKDRSKRSVKIKPGDMLSPVTDLKNIQPEIIVGCEKAPPVEESPLGGGATSPKHGCPDENLEPEAKLQNLTFEHSPVVREKIQSPNAESPAPQEMSEHLEPFGGHSPVHHVDDLNSPWFEVKKTVLNSPMGSYPLTEDKKQKVHGCSKLEGGPKCLFKSSMASDKDNSEYSDGLDKFDDSDASTPEPSAEEKDAGNRLFAPVRGEADSAQEVSSAKKAYPVEEDVRTSPKTSFVGKSMLFQSKRLCSNGVDFGNFSPVLHTPKASGNSDDVLTECFDHSPEDGLERVVSLLGLALEKVKNRMLSVTNRRCSEILVSTAEEIHSQLRSVESQFQTDIGKLTSLKTSKRKYLETRLQEQQVHLKVMHEKFKEEICQYIQDCKGAMEGLEAQHIELQGAIEWQKALHRKLLLQSEAAVETHLTDAQRQMMLVRKLGKQKMQQLKVAIAECLKDGISR